MNRLLLSLLLLAASTSLFAVPGTAPSFTVSDGQGREISLPRSHNGVDIYLFWASWCPYCKALMPHLQSMLEEYGDDVRVYAFNIRDDEDPHAFMAKNGYEFTLVPDADPLMERYGVKATPGLFLVDGKGWIRLNLYELIGGQRADEDAMSNSAKASRRAPWWAAQIRTAIDKILQEQKPGEAPAEIFQ